MVPFEYKNRQDLVMNEIKKTDMENQQLKLERELQKIEKELSKVNDSAKSEKE